MNLIPRLIIKRHIDFVVLCIHYFITMCNNRNCMYCNSIQTNILLFYFSVVLQLGGSESQRFRGTLSLVQSWDVSRSNIEVINVLNAKAAPVTSPSYTRGLTADWAWDSFQPGPGITRMSPSTRGQIICPSGQHLNADGSTCVNKLTGNLDGGVTEICILDFPAKSKCI